MAMFPLSQEPTCFMQHYGLITTWERAVVTDNTGSPKPDSNISANLPKGISPFDLPDKNNEEFNVMWEQDQGDEISKDSNELLLVHHKLGHCGMIRQKTKQLQHTKMCSLYVRQGDQAPMENEGSGESDIKIQGSRGSGLHRSAHGVHAWSNQANQWVLNTCEVSLHRCVP